MCGLAHGYSKVTSPFGRRRAPAKGSSSFHSGVDLAVPEGTNLLSVIDGKVTLAQFQGAGGCSVTVKNEEFQVSFCHVSPKYLVYVGQYVKKGQVIARVGPFHVYDIPNNPYKDKNGLPTNGASTGVHLHLTIKKDGTAVNPLNLF